MRLTLPMLLLVACDTTPSHVGPADIDDAFARDQYKTVCKGLEMEVDDTRRYAADRLKKIKDPMALECVCTHLPDEKAGWDAAIADGLTGTDRDDMVGCFADLVLKTDLPNRVEAVVALSSMPADRARETLAIIAKDTASDTAVRARALKTLGGDKRQEEMLRGLLASDPDTTVRATAAAGMSTFKGKESREGLRTAIAGDAEGAVRAAALTSLKTSGARDADDAVCKAMLDDPSPDVRSAAIGAFKGTKRAKAIACLRTKAFTVEEDGGVRERLIAVLKGSPSDDAAKVLCDAIPFFMRNYVTTDLPEKIPGTDIIKAQNDRDWERSYACVQSAYQSSGGYSCYAKMYTAFWFRQLGGNAYVPNCPGYENDALK